MIKEMKRIKDTVRSRGFETLVDNQAFDSIRQLTAKYKTKPRDQYERKDRNLKINTFQGNLL